MALTKEQRIARDGKLTASGIGVLMRGEPEPIRELWRELIGDPTWTPKDLSNVWPVRLGAATEQLHLDWLSTKLGGEISSRGKVVTHHLHNWAACTLDGFLDDIGVPVEVKHVNGFEQRETVVQRYYPQMTWIMIVTGSRQCLFSVIEGAREPIQEYINFDRNYADELFTRAKAFMEHVWNLSEPVEMPPLAVPVNASKGYDFSGNNLFCDLAVEWLDTRLGAKRNETAKKRLKELMPGDASCCIGGGIVMTRDRAGRINIAEGK